MDNLPQLSSCCCGPQTAESGRRPQISDAPWIVGSVSTTVGEIPQVGTTLGPADRWGAWKARWGIGRMRYSVPPGLYAVAEPTADSPVFVSANYKMSFDRLRAQLGGLNAWILVLDTKGINVWCAAGKGTFGTDELVRRIEAAGLSEVVSLRRLIVPQLGAPGVAAHEVKKQSGFRVVYGPVRAEDLPAFLAAGRKATPPMRKVHFPLRDRLAVVPVELAMSVGYVLLIAAGLLLLAGLGPDGYRWSRVADRGLPAAILFMATCVGSVVLVPALLPWLPGRALSVKGAWLGLGALAGLLLYESLRVGVFDGLLGLAAWCLLIPAAASFLGMNFTGATTYTSLSGVRKEMARAVPLQAIAVVAGVALWLVGRFVVL